ncbi:AzlC family ABC transporter permease [Nocardioides panacisoli]|uniref:AzlC family ABC transporter permease n=1 Tax=Nocardioides panacisoli TaxID=627624 RepID=UPI001C637877|nr:AzlC family ABC transporter permease [Nocardioides panacisoli]QYJ05639.1 AzlC family ABC transporter permease [Nocardioides panacisoli]
MSEPESVVSGDRAPIVRRALLDAVPLIIPAVPFALVVGLAITESGLGNLLGWTTAPVVFAGAAQLTLITLLGGGAFWVAAVGAALVVNARHLMYSAALARYFRGQPRWFRWFAPYLLIDQVFALATLRRGDDPRTFRTYYLAMGAAFAVFWFTAVALGLLIGPVVPEEWQLKFAIPVMFTGIVVMAIDRAPKLVAATVAVLVTWLSAGLPSQSGLLVGAVAGVAAGFGAGYLAERRSRR